MGEAPALGLTIMDSLPVIGPPVIQRVLRSAAANAVDRNEALTQGKTSKR